MTQIQATVSVVDKVDSKIEQKIKAIGVASEKTAQQLSILDRVSRSLSSQNVNLFSNAVASLGRTNFTNVHKQMQQLSTITTQVGAKFSAQATASVRLQIAQTKLQREQTKLAIIQQRLQKQTNLLAISRQRLATASANTANAEARLATATSRSEIAKKQTLTATVRLEHAKLRLEQQMNRTANSVQRNNLTLGQLVGTLTAVGGAFSGAVGLATLGDEYQRAINKLTLVTSSAEQARDRLSTLGQVAINSYGGLDSVTQLYTRLDLALKQTGGSASEAIQMTQTLSKATALAGLTTSETNSALLQISQAFNKGKLDGDEFRTVMETMPPLADALARQLGVTRGELLKLAPEGKITGEVMKKAVLDMSEYIDNKFSQLTPTVSMHLQNLQTQAQIYFGGMFKDSGMATLMGEAIQGIANNLDTATRLALAFGTAVTLAMSRTAIMAFFAQVTAVKTALTGVNGVLAITNTLIKTSPVGILIGSLTALGFILDSVFDGAISKTLFPNFDQDQAKAEDYIARLKDIGGQLDLMSYSKLKQEQHLLDQAVLTNTQNYTKFETKLADVQEAIAKKEKALASAKQEVEAYNNGTKETINYYGLWGIVVDEQVQAQERVKRITEELINLRAKEVNALTELENTTESKNDLMRLQLGLYEEQIERINTARQAIEGKTQKDIEASAELQAQKKIVDEAKTSYVSLSVAVTGLRSALQGILGLNADLGVKLNDSIEKSKDKVSQEIIQRLKADAEWKEKYAKASETEQQRMDIEKRLSKDIEQLRGNNVAEKEIQNLINSQLQATQAVEARRKADAEARSSSKKAQSEAKREAEKKADEIKRAKEEHQRYLQGLEDEHSLLQQGLQNYNNYREVYALRIKLQEKGVNLSDKEIEQLKTKIDANERLKELAQEINRFEENSLQKQREQIALRLEALSKANLSDKDRQIASENIMSDLGGVGSVNQGVTSITEQYRLYYDAINQMRMTDLERERAVNTIKRQEQEDLHRKRIENMEAMGGMWSVTATAIESFEQNASRTFANVLTGTQSITDGLRDLSATILTDVVKALTKMATEWIAQQMSMAIAGQSISATNTATATAEGTAIATAYAPAATMASMATQGSSATAGMMAMMAGVALVPTLLSKVLGQRRHGGSVRAGGMYQVGEGNAPEIYQSSSGRQYMIAGDNGRVFSNKQSNAMMNGGKVVNITQNVTINGNGQLDAKTLQEMRQQTKSIVYEVLINEQREAGGMLA